ncbi:MAG: hypothetical protein WAW11_00690 [Patescibacteria group bacterium]
MNQIVKKRIALVLKIVGGLIASFILLLLAGFLAVRLNLTRTAGDIDQNTNFYNSLANNLAINFLPNSQDKQLADDAKVYCSLYMLSDYADYNTATILSVYENNKSYELAEKMILAVQLRLSNNQELTNKLSICNQEDVPKINLTWLQEKIKTPKHPNVFKWQNEEPWQIIRQAVVKDKDQINRAGQELGLSPRLILSVAIVEQLRLYYTQRELFERVFKPLKILASANKMAWGVMSIKEAAAILAENNLKDNKSVFYLGDKYQHLLDFSTSDITKERYTKLTDEKNHYYSYLYGGVIIKEFIAQWQKAGYDIEDRPEILATLFNIGLQNSKPKENPQVGGSKITIGDSDYVFGSLAYEFYYSGDLIGEFPYSINH